MPKILDRLVSQLQAKGMDIGEANAVSRKQLHKHGLLYPNSDVLTVKGEQRNDMSPADRAKDRASKYSGGIHSPSDYEYNARTNMATVKKKKPT